MKKILLKQKTVFKRLKLPCAHGHGGCTTLVLLTAIIAFIAAAVAPTALLASAEKVDDGIKFTYYDPDAGQVFLSGSFNSWNSTSHPMTKGDDGNWTVVIELSAGEHEYKFVVDGAWITDMDNPDTKADPYGGLNSIVVIGSNGEIVAQEAATPTSNTRLSSMLYIDGRYLARLNTERDIAGDPRWRLMRPIQDVDFNFRISISDMVKGYARLRIDTRRTVQDMNSVSANLDEAKIDITPDPFSLYGYYSMEILQSKDPYPVFGDIDLPGTIFDDHLQEGKGTAGVIVHSNSLGFELDAFVVNVDDYSIYNDPDLYDNTGTDLVNVRASKRIRNFNVGAGYNLRRNLWWLDFADVTGATPSNTGIPRLDEYLDRSGDPSDWFRLDDRLDIIELDLSLYFLDDRLVPELEYVRGKSDQVFVTGNNSGLDQNNGPIDVPIYDRDVQILHGSINSQNMERVTLKLEHTRTDYSNWASQENMLLPEFLPQNDANKQIYYTIVDDPPVFTYDYSEFEVRYTGWSAFTPILWLQRHMWKYERPEEGSKEYQYAFTVSPGLGWTPAKWLSLELEQEWRTANGTPHTLQPGGRQPVDAFEENSIETILRGNVGLTSKLAAIFDVRSLWLKYENLDGSEESYTYINPWIGIQFEPMSKVSLVLAYGVDPLAFGIDYKGRHVGRWNFRQEYYWTHPDATRIDAEQALEDKKMIVLRAIYIF